MRSVLYTFAPVQTTSQAPVFLRFFRLQSKEGITTPHSLQGWFDFAIVNDPSLAVGQAPSQALATKKRPKCDLRDHQ